MLPFDILEKRIRNELKECRKNFNHKIEYGKKFTIPFEICITFKDIPGPVWKNGRVITKYEHSFKIIITEKYPYQMPIVRWESDIFHPNIMPPSDGGYVCTKLLERWTFNSNLVLFIKGLEVLLSSPNPKNPFENDTCTKAAEYFNRHPYMPSFPKKKPFVIGEI